MSFYGNGWLCAVASRGASTIARDITDRKRSEAQISVLARKAEHRANNLMANVKAMVQLSHSDTPVFAGAFWGPKVCWLRVKITAKREWQAQESREAR
jgi:hypothetical protein